MYEEESLVLTGPKPPYEPCSGGLGVEIYRSMLLNIDKFSLQIAQTEVTSSCGDILERSRKTALYLQSKKFTKEDLVCLCSHNQIHSSIPLLAALFANVKYSSVDPSMGEDDLEYLLDYIKPNILFVAENVEEKIERCLKKADVVAEIIVFGKSDKHIPFEHLLNTITDEQNFTPVFVDNLKETAIIFFSSGTTGKPKGICINHYSLLSQIINAAHLWSRDMHIHLSNYSYARGNREKLKFLSYSPMYWVSGVILLLKTVLLGNTILLGSDFDSKKTWQIINKLKPTGIFLPPGQVAELYLERRIPSHDVEIFLVGGGKVTSTHMSYINEMFPKATAIQGYGMTEVTGEISSFWITDSRSVELQKKHPQSCGEICFGISCKIVDLETGRTCGYNEEGELRIKTKYFMNGYYKSETSSAFDSNGWYKSGDLAYFNEDNCLIIVDRIKELLLYKVHNIRPSVIEQILAQHPSVYESFVIGIPHMTDNEHPMGVVVLKEEYVNKVTPEEIVTYVNQRVTADKYKIRAGIKFLKEIIKTPSGKIKKHKMKELIIQGKL